VVATALKANAQGQERAGERACPGVAHDASTDAEGRGTKAEQIGARDEVSVMWSPHVYHNA
jgi:hypothetical protein